MNRYDRFTHETVRGGLEPGESIQLTALLHQNLEHHQRWLSSGYFFAAATDRRLVLVATEKGWWTLKTVNLGVQQFPYDDLASVDIGGRFNQRRITLVGKPGTTIELGINTLAGMAGQGAFIHELPRLVTAWKARPRD